ncbi:MAG: hypothetical protein ACI9UU_003564 [Candidatus Azotimanducaceae bacterium]|jgi:hypothetical protein
MIECTMVSGVENLIIKPQTEASAAESVGPDLGVLTVTANLLVVPLFG